ncbi:MAG: acetate kinase [Candidatus Westeberhardia cardiocondylae]|nr:acetate kinase [Candidatus Westeberhardia cardiocondylae]
MLNKLILVLNCGSSSVKFSIFNFYDEQRRLFGFAEFFSFKKVYIQWSLNNVIKSRILSSVSSIDLVLDYIIFNVLLKELRLLGEVFAVGHRIVHGGLSFIKSEIINDNVVKGIEESIPFAPLHNPAHLIGISKIMKQFPSLVKRNVAVFDTSFYQNIPEEAYLYPLPYYFYKNYGIRRYGAHGLSHYYVFQESAKFLNKSCKNLNIITCHLGNGSSISAISNGCCVDTSMGLTPLEGLVMGTRCGDIDPSIIFYLYEKFNISLENIKKILTEQSGLLGLNNGVSYDCRDIEKNYYDVSSGAHRAINVFCYRLAKYIGAYSILMDNSLDAVIFTGGIGENSVLIRELTLRRLKLLNFKLDHKRNLSIHSGKSGFITTCDSSISAIVIPTCEELVIVRDVVSLLG